MKAAVCGRYGGPETVRVVNVPRPEPGAGEVLVRVKAAAVTSGDARIRAARFPGGFAIPARVGLGFRGPRQKVLGTSFSGVVEASAGDSAGFAVGDEVCGMTGRRMGAHAEYLTVPVTRIVRKPASVSHEDAAGVVFGGSTALHFLRDKAHVQPGMTVLINGASGAVGTNAVQLARHFGATVTAVTSGASAVLVTELGATSVIDYTKENVATLDERFDVVVDTVGNLSTDGLRLLKPSGVLVLVVTTLWRTIRARGRVIVGVAPTRADAFAFLLGLVESGELTVVLDSAYSLDDIAAAYVRVDTGHKHGNVIVRP